MRGSSAQGGAPFGSVPWDPSLFRTCRGTGLPRFDASSVEDCDLGSIAGRTTGTFTPLAEEPFGERKLHPRVIADNDRAN